MPYTKIGSVWPSLGASIGQGIGSALSQAVDLMQQEKLMQMQMKYGLKAQEAQQQQYAKSLEPILGREIAQFVSGLSPKEREVVMQNIGSLMQLRNTQPQDTEQAQSGLDLLRQPIQQQQMQPVPFQGSIFDKLMQLNNAPGAKEGYGIMQKPQQVPQSPLEFFQQQTSPIARATGQPSYTEATEGVEPRQPFYDKYEDEKTSRFTHQNQPQAKDSRTREELLQDIFTPLGERREREKMALQKQKLAQQERQMAQQRKARCF